MLHLLKSRPTSLTLISLWCWLNVVAMIPTLSEPVMILFGLAARGSSAILLKMLIFANAIAISTAVSVRLRAGSLVLIGWLTVMLASTWLTDLVPTCPWPVKIAAYKQVLFGGLLPYLYVTLVPTTTFLPMHLINTAVTIAIVAVLVKHRRLFKKRRPVFHTRAKGMAQ